MPLTVLQEILEDGRNETKQWLGEGPLGHASVAIVLSLQWFKQFWFLDQTVHLGKGFLCISVQFEQKDTIMFRLWFLKQKAPSFPDPIRVTRLLLYNVLLLDGGSVNTTHLNDNMYSNHITEHFHTPQNPYKKNPRVRIFRFCLRGFNC